MKNNYLKDRSIKIFKLISSRDEDGFEIITKQYIHPKCKTLKAYFRELRSTEIAINKQNKDETEAIFIVNRRLITKDMFVEYSHRRTFGTETYQITGVDPYDDSGYDLKLNVKKVNPPVYDSEEGVCW